MGFMVVIAPPGETIAMQCAGLLDTGTATTMLSPRVVQALHLRETGETEEVGGMGGTGTNILKVYYVDVLLPFNGHNEPIVNLRVCGMPKDPKYFHVLVGLDILCRGTLIMRNHTFTFSIGEDA
jgi:hypothetical protein